MEGETLANEGKILTKTKTKEQVKLLNGFLFA